MNRRSNGEITVVDYGTGNIRNVFNAFSFLGLDVCVTSDPRRIAGSERLVLPGVGAFGDCSRALKKTGAASAVRDFIDTGRPYLGICLGLQILFENSDECPDEPGLGIFKGRTVRFSPGPGLKVPHMGWNRVALKKKSKLFSGVEEGSWFYFVHSFHVESAEDSIVAAESEHGVVFTAAVEKKSVFACQFHPEKSSGTGLKILRNFSAFQPEGP